MNVTGSLVEKRGIYHAVATYYDNDNKRQKKWKSTRLKVKGNKKRAEAILNEFIDELKKELDKSYTNSLQYTDFYLFLKRWLKLTKATVQETTYSIYQKQVDGRIKRYFHDDKKISLELLKPINIQEFYLTILDDNCTTNTVIHYHALIRKALQYAVKNDLIPSNPADKVDRPQKNTFVGSFYTVQETEILFECMANTKLEIPTLLACFYGLRRSEVVGLRWSSIDFQKKLISINHVITDVEVDGVRKIRSKDRTKTKSSYRSLPLIPAIEEKLLQVRDSQQARQKLLKSGYCDEYLDYICVDDIGNLIRPDFISKKFKKILLQQDQLKVVRFHDLRHTCASLLLASGISLKEIQEWLGHSHFSTTADIYAHLDSSSKNNSAMNLSNTLKLSV